MQNMDQPGLSSLLIVLTQLNGYALPSKLKHKTAFSDPLLQFKNILKLGIDF